MYIVLQLFDMPNFLINYFNFLRQYLKVTWKKMKDVKREASMIQVYVCENF